jgi:hypothetical protein
METHRQTIVNRTVLSLCANPFETPRYEAVLLLLLAALLAVSATSSFAADAPAEPTKVSKPDLVRGEASTSPRVRQLYTVLMAIRHIVNPKSQQHRNTWSTAGNSGKRKNMHHGWFRGCVSETT